MIVYGLDIIPLKEYNKNKVAIVIYEGFFMELLTTMQMAEKWGISRRRVTALCKERRLDGAILRGNTWLIPDDTEKPEDLRRVRKNGQRISIMK